MTAPIESWTGRVVPEWIDYNGHMSEGYYGLVFGHASDEYLLRIGFNSDYRSETAGAFYTVETHISFLSELPLDEPLRVVTAVLGVDPIRLQLFHELQASNGTTAATQEVLLLHIDTTVVRVSPMHEALLSIATTDAAGHEGVTETEEFGKAISGPGSN